MKQQTKFKQTEIGKIPEDWEVVKLGSVCDVKSGKRLRKGRVLVEYKTGHPYIRVRDLSNGSVKVNELLFLDKETHKEISRYIITKDDVYISIVGTIGLVGTIPKEICGANLTENCARLTNLTKSTKEWLSFYLNSKSGQDQIKSLTVGTTQGKLALFRIKDINIPLPKLGEQSAIASILSSLDEKIELNNKMNKTLEAIGQAIFQRWFVDEKKDEWKIGKLGDIGKIQPGFAFKSSDFQKEGYKLIKIRNIQSPVIDIIKVEDHLSEEIFHKTDKRFYLDSGDVLIAMTGAELGKVGIIQRVNKKMLLNQRVGKAVSNYPFLFYLHLISPEVQGILTGIASASSAQGNVSNSDIEKIEIVLPKKEVLELFTNSTSGLFNKLIDNLAENQTLSQLRDSLLPKLMSGEIRVPLE